MSEYAVESYYEEDDEQETPCPECKGRCYDRNDDPCRGCHGEGVIIVLTSRAGA